jgi:hypothetical protein
MIRPMATKTKKAGGAVTVLAGTFHPDATLRLYPRTRSAGFNLRAHDGAEPIATTKVDELCEASFDSLEPGGLYWVVGEDPQGRERGLAVTAKAA